MSLYIYIHKYDMRIYRERYRYALRLAGALDALAGGGDPRVLGRTARLTSYYIV